MALDFSRITVIIIGPQGSGKSAVERVLRDSFVRDVKIKTLQPPMEGETKVITVDNMVGTGVHHVIPGFFGDE
jgi:predicted ATP-binding protein involved in virulence